MFGALAPLLPLRPSLFGAGSGGEAFVRFPPAHTHPFWVGTGRRGICSLIRLPLSAPAPPPRGAGRSRHLHAAVTCLQKQKICYLFSGFLKKSTKFPQILASEILGSEICFILGRARTK